MTDLIWTPVSPLQSVSVGKNHSANGRGIVLQEVNDFALVQIMARRGKWTACVKAAKAVFGVAPPDQPRITKSKDFTLIWSGPDQFLVFSALNERPNHQELAQQLTGIASLSDQTDGRVLISVSGPKVRDMLAKICSLDLHADAFAVDCASITAIDHLSTNIWRGDDNNDGHAVFNLLLLSTFAVSLWGLLMDSAAEYGVKIETNSML